MQIPGHLAVGLAQHCLPPLSRNKQSLLPLLAAAIFPDAVDKFLGYVLHVMPNGRHFAHNLFSLLGTSLCVTIGVGRQAGLAWFVGYLGHLVVDSKQLVPWFFPFYNYHFQQGKLLFDRKQILKEGLFLLLVLIVHRLGR